MKALYFISSKGGSGKSFIIKKISKKLSGDGKRVLVCELCSYGRYLDLLFDATDSVLYDLSDVAEGTASFEDSVCEIDENLFLLCAPLNKKNFDVKELLKIIIDKAKDNFDFIFFDASFEENMNEYKEIYEESEFVFVSDCSGFSLRNADAVISKFESGIRLIINRVNPTRIEKGYDKAVDELLDVFHIPLLGVVYEAEDGFDDKMNYIKKEDEKLHKEVFERISKRISGENVPITPYKKTNVINKLFG